MNAPRESRTRERPAARDNTRGAARDGTRSDARRGESGAARTGTTRREPALLSIGRLAERTGLSISAIRFYEAEGLVSSTRNVGGQRRFERGVIRRLSFVRITQGLGFSLAEIRAALAALPDGRTPTARDWERLGRRFDADIERRIEGLTRLRETLSGCIGCGCLSLARCKLYNPDDRAARLGAGPRYLLGNRPEDAEPVD